MRGEIPIPTNTRTWLAMDPIKDGGNWYQYCNSNPVTYWDPLGLNSIAMPMAQNYFNIMACGAAATTALTYAGAMVASITPAGWVTIAIVVGGVIIYETGLAEVIADGFASTVESIGLHFAKKKKEEQNGKDKQGTNTGDQTSNKKGVGGKGWRGDKKWKEDVNKVKEGGTIEDLNGQVPTEQEASV